MKKSLVVSLFSLLMPSLFFAQSGKVEIMKDAKLDALVKKQGMVIPPATSPQSLGYRIQLFFDSDRTLLDTQRAKFIALFPKIDTYVTYKAPNYFLKIGDFRSLLDAERLKNQLLKDFPTSFVVKEMINLPRIDQD